MEIPLLQDYLHLWCLSRQTVKVQTFYFSLRNAIFEFLCKNDCIFRTCSKKFDDRTIKFIMKSFLGEGGSRALGAKGNKGKARGHKIRKLGDIVYGWFLKVIS